MFLKRNSPSDKDIKNPVLIFYHLSFHNDSSNMESLNKFLTIAGLQETLSMIKNVLSF